jgi:hypothetical protein
MRVRAQLEGELRLRQAELERAHAARRLQGCALGQEHVEALAGGQDQARREPALVAVDLERQERLAGRAQSASFHVPGPSVNACSCPS